MKQLLLLCSLCSFTAFSQTGLTNLDFENWAGSNPNGFTIASGVSQQTATPQSGSRYVRVTSNGQSFPNVAGYMALQGSGNNMLAGAPCSLSPVSITGYIRTNMVGTDTVHIKGHLRKNFSTIVAVFNYSVSQTISSWQQITIPVNYNNGLTPDTMQFGVIANKGFLNMRPSGGNGTYIELDNFSLVLPPTGINETVQSGNWTVYPNPASGSLHFETADDFTGTVGMYDVRGRKVKEVSIAGGKNNVSLQGLEPGLYVYRIMDVRDGTVQSGRVIVTD